MQTRWIKMDKDYVNKVVLLPLGNGEVSLSFASYDGKPSILVEALKEQHEMFTGVQEDDIDKTVIPILITFSSEEGVFSLRKALNAIQSIFDEERQNNK